MEESTRIGELNHLLRQVSGLRRLTLEESKKIVRRAEEKASALNVPVSITILDPGGNLICQERMDHAILVSISTSRAKALTAVSLETTTEKAAGDILPGHPLYGLQHTHAQRYCFFGGGIPLFSGKILLGGVGISGGTVEQDMQIASYAARGYDGSQNQI